MQRTYEIMFIVRPDILDEDLDKLIAGFEGTSPPVGAASSRSRSSAAASLPTR